MAHWRTYLESDVIRFVDLDGRDLTVQIAKVKKGKVTGKGGKSSAKAMITLEGWPKPIGAGSDTLEQIAAHFGHDTKEWVGKWVIIWPDPTVKYGSDRVGGVRIRPKLPTPEDIAIGVDQIAKAKIAREAQAKEEAQAKAAARG